MHSLQRSLLVSILVLATFSTRAPAEDQQAVARKVENLLRTCCYRCHGQDGANEGGFNYLLDRDRLVKSKKVRPGDPLRSRLYKRVAAGEMPPEDERPRPTAAEVLLLKEWIEAGAPNFTPPQAPRLVLAPAAVHKFILTDLQRSHERDRRFLRYLVLTHLHNAGLSEDELQSYRHGLSKLLNSLSWERHVKVPVRVDPAGTILRIDLRDYLWNEKIWQLLVDANPYRLTAGDADLVRIVQATQCPVPLVRGDWFVAAASHPPLYHDILQLPGTDRELERLLHVDVQENIRQERVARAGFNGSGVSQNNRLLERHESGYGAYWKSYDFAGNADRQNLFAHPLGPGEEEDRFQHAGGEIIFNLPNGLQAYLLVDGRGRRLDKGPTAIVSDPRRPDRAVENGISCMSCHARGMIDKTDQIRAHVESNRAAFSQADLDTIRALYPPADKFAALLKEDAQRFAEAVGRTGAPLSRSEPIVALKLRFESALDLPLVAAELSVSPAQLLQALERSPRLARILGPVKVEGGTIQRQTFLAAFADILTDLAPRPSRPGAGGVPLPASASESLINSIGMKLVQIPAGKFVMGSPKQESGHGEDEEQHEVEIRKPFFLGVYEVTQGEYDRVMNARPSHFAATGAGKDRVAGLDTRRFPVDSVSWEEAKEFCRKLSALTGERQAGRVYRLPTEAEWEYACRGGVTPDVPFHVGKALSSEDANFDGNHPFGDAATGPYLERTSAVGSFRPNGFGLYDMHGNVGEWCEDWHAEDFYDKSPAADPAGPARGSERVWRGGSWFAFGLDCRAASRHSAPPASRQNTIGFRVVCVRGASSK